MKYNDRNEDERVARETEVSKKEKGRNMYRSVIIEKLGKIRSGA